MRILFALTLFIVLWHPSAHATQCTNNTYGNITCKQVSGLLTNTCGTVSSSIFTVATGDVVDVWLDANGGATTALTGTGGITSYSITIPDQIVFVNGTSIHDIRFSGIATSNATINITPSCGGSYEMVVVDMHSSVGTPTVNCTSGTFSSGNAISTISASCTSTTTSGFALSSTDWVNSQPLASSPFARIEDVAGEFIFSENQITSTGTVTATWTKAVGGDSLADGLIVWGDGGGVAGVGSGMGGKSAVGGKSGVGI